MPSPAPHTHVFSEGTKHTTRDQKQGKTFLADDQRQKPVAVPRYEPVGVHGLVHATGRV